MQGFYFKRKFEKSLDAEIIISTGCLKGQFLAGLQAENYFLLIQKTKNPSIACRLFCLEVRTTKPLPGSLSESYTVSFFIPCRSFDKIFLKNNIEKYF